jgi:trimethylamine--corrinoid protein Co-methyltransferase
VRLVDALPNVDQVSTAVFPHDVPAPVAYLEDTAVTLRNTVKPILGPVVERPEEVPFYVEMFAACCGGLEQFRRQPTITFFVCPVSPLRFTRDVAGAILALAESGAPIGPMPAPTLGATCPVTMAGGLAQQHAEALACLAIAAVARPGISALYASRIGPTDMRTALSAWGGPEVGMTGAGAGHLARRIGLACDAYGLASNSRVIDAQFAYERLANALIPALAGVEILSGVGTGGAYYMPEIAVIDDEIVGLIRHIVAGAAIDDATLAFDVMRQVILGDGVFLDALHTVRQVRAGALWIPDLSVRGAGYADATGDTVVDRARHRAADILASHQVEPFPDEVQRHLDDIMAHARRELAP